MSKPRSRATRPGLSLGAQNKRMRVNSTRSSHEDAPNKEVTAAAAQAQTSRQMKKTRLSDVSVRASKDVPAIPVSAATEVQEESPWDLLMRLDSWQRPGLPVSQFRKLFKNCTCGLVMTARVFETHECARVVEPGDAGNSTLVDLTTPGPEAE
ncbi:hypothetical protein BJ138DRAFT_1119238 [Hygrophoropsis aurantiaca]|uniref:Uncharacterized protein n=1 Tax=Hygrophoropsis aurantiaca TaxID=72124 RepID=A0ACB7ZU95_9AGAM|nr:hypothetical protein BJ138DRAFT_1119238 [Hygrophoropsis aurantiaca]